MDDVAIATCTNEANRIEAITDVLKLAEWHDLSSNQKSACSMCLTWIIYNH